MSSALHTPASQKLIVEKAIRFIRKRIQVHNLEFALQVGQHLFEGLFKGDEKLVGSAHRWKKESIQAIARDPRVELDDDRLYMCVHAYLAVRKYGKQSRRVKVPQFSPWKWGRIWGPLQHDPEALSRVVIWIETEGVSRNLVRSVANLVRPYLAAGGQLDDLLVSADGPSPYKRMKRVLGVVRRRVERASVPDVAHERTVKVLDELVTVLGQ